MSTLQSRFHSPQGRKACSPKQIQGKCLSPSATTHPKPQQKNDHKSPKTNKDKRSPNKKVTTKPLHDTKVTGLAAPLGNKSNGNNQGPTGTLKDGKKTEKGLKGSKPKHKQTAQNALPFDNRVENKVRRSDHHIIVPPHDVGVPFKQKSHSVKSVCVPQELLLSPQGHDQGLTELVNKKFQTVKNSNAMNEMDPKELYSMDLLGLHNKHSEENKGNNVIKKIKNQKNANDHYSIWPDNKPLPKDSQKYAQAYESHTNPYNMTRTPQKQNDIPWHENEELTGQMVYNMIIPEEPRERELKAVPRRKLNTPETSPPSKIHNESKKKIQVKVSPRNFDSVGMLKGLGQSTKSHKSSIHDSQQLKTNYMLEPQKDRQRSKESSTIAGGHSHTNSLSPSKNTGGEGKGKSKGGKEVKTQNKSSNNQGDIEGLIASDFGEGSISPIKPQNAKYSAPHIYMDTNNYMNLLIHGKNKRASEAQVRGHQSSQVVKDNYILSTRSALDRQENRFGVNVHTEGNEVYQDQEEKNRITRSLKLKKDSLKNHENKQDNEEDEKANQIVNELLKGSSIKELKINPNAKFLLLRKQIQEKRSKVNFKSADWNVIEQCNQKQSINCQTSPVREHSASPTKSQTGAAQTPYASMSPHKEARALESAKTAISETVSKEQLLQLYNRTKEVLTKYRNKEKDWEKERKLFINEIKRLRELAWRGLKL